MRIYDPTSATYCADSGNALALSITKCGYLYNFVSASAGWGSVSHDSYQSSPTDICPAGWRLPKANGSWQSNANGLNEFANLNTAMFGDPELTTSSNYYDSAHAVNWVFAGPWRSVLSGVWTNYSGMYSQGDSFQYYSSTVAYGNSAYFLYGGDGYVTPSIGGGSGEGGDMGSAVRCLL
jgi:uncharacterized protein (TIGR02145 family)